MYIQRHPPVSSNMKPMGMKTLLLVCPRVGGPDVAGLIMLDLQIDQKDWSLEVDFYSCGVYSFAWLGCLLDS